MPAHNWSAPITSRRRLTPPTPFDRTPYFCRTLLVAADLPAIDLDKSDGRGFGLHALAGPINDSLEADTHDKGARGVNVSSKGAADCL